jgi:nucleoside-diphosphate-sugar epimerase
MRYLITGGKRGLGLALANNLPNHEVYAPSSKEWDVRNTYTFDNSTQFDRVIVNAAIKDDFTALNSDPSTVLDVLNVNAVGALRTVQSVQHCLSPAAKIVFLTSQMGSSALTGAITLHGRYGDHYIEPTYSIAYRMSKAAVNKLVQCLALDLKSQGIAVYAIDPGWPQTSMGGQFATMPVDYCATSILTTIEQLTIEDSGKFFDWKGDLLEW